MSAKEILTDFSRGDDLRFFWQLFMLREKTKCAFVRRVFTFMMSRSAHRHGGYVGPGAVIKGIPSLPHGLHGVFISRYAVLGKNCRIYHNVTIGETGGLAPVIGDGCLIGAGAVIVGAVRVGQNVKIGAGAVVSADVPDGSTVVAQPPRIYERERN